MADLALNIKIKAINDTGSAVKDLLGDFRSIAAIQKDLARQGGRGIGGIGKRAKSASSGIDEAARGIADLGRSAEGLIGAPIDAATKFETSLTNIKTLSGAAAISTGELADITRDAAKQFGGTAPDQADALYDIISAGASSAAEAQGTLTAANKFAIGGLTDVGTATQAISATTANFAKQNIDSAKAADLLFSIVDSGRTTADKAARAFPKVASAAGGIGLEAEQAAGAFAFLTRTAATTGQASTQLANLIAATQKPTAQAREALEKLNKERAKLGKDELRIDSSALKELGVAEFAAQFSAENVSPDVLAQLFGNQRARAAIVAFNQDLASLSGSIEASAKSAGQNEKAFKKQDESRAQRLKVLNAKLDDARLSIGEALVPVVDGLMPSLLALSEVAGFLAKEAPGLTGAVGAFSIGAIGLGKVAQGFVSIRKASSSLADVYSATGPLRQGINAFGESLGNGAKAGLAASVFAAAFALGTVADEFFGFSDKIAGLCGGDEFFDNINDREAATTQDQILNRKRSDLASLNELIENAGVLDDFSGRTEAREAERDRLISEIRRMTQPPAEGAPVAGGRGRAPGSASTPKVQLDIKVDQEGRVTGAKASNADTVSAGVGQGLALGT